MSDWGTDQYEAQEVRLHNNVYRVTIRPLPEQYTSGMQVRFKATATSTGALSLRLQGLRTDWLSETPIARIDGTATQAGDVTSGELVALTYDGTAFRLQKEIVAAYTPPASGTVSIADSIPAKKTITSVTHSLLVAPKTVRTVIVCISTELGYAAGDEVDVSQVIANENDKPAFVVVATASHLHFIVQDTNDVVQLPNRSAAYLFTEIDRAKWSVKAYISL